MITVENQPSLQKMYINQQPLYPQYMEENISEYGS